MSKTAATKTAKAPKAAKAPATPKRLTEEDIRKKHPKAAIVEGTLFFVDPANKVAKSGGRKVQDEVYEKHPGKQVVLINTVGSDGKPDNHTRWVATSDLHHVTMTEDTAKAVRLERLKVARAKRNKVKAKAKKAEKAEKAEPAKTEPATEPAKVVEPTA
jgi:hypothetical protein